MCLNIKVNATFKVAETDIVVYKMLERPYLYASDSYMEMINHRQEETRTKDTLSSPYQGMLYTLNRIYTTNLQEEPELQTFDEECLVDTEYDAGEYLSFAIDEGFHSFESIDNAKRLADDYPANYSVVVECVIPKGTRYYEGVWGLYHDTMVGSFASEVLELRGIVYEAVDEETSDNVVDVDMD